MRHFIERFAKPEYVFNPKQLFLRILRRKRSASADYRTITMPWGAQIRADIHDTIGLSLWHLGVYELVVSEVLWRLIDRGDAVADIGANFGYMTNLMAIRCGGSGRVDAFEPHPDMFRRLSENVSLLGKKGAAVRLHAVALGHENGTAELVLPKHFGDNAGVAFIKRPEHSLQADLNVLNVQVKSADHVFDRDRPPVVVKIDVEGNEANVFSGAQSLLSDKKVRDIVFEDHGAYPTPAMRILEEHGYALYKLRRSFLGPILVDPREAEAKRPWEPTNYLATSDARRALARLSRRGWRCLANDLNGC